MPSPRIVFPYLAQLHQVLHSLPIAAELARQHPDIEVHVATSSPAHRAFIERLVAQHAPRARLHYDSLELGWLDRFRHRAFGIPWKLAALFRHRRYFSGFDAIVTPERTSLLLRRFGVRHPRLIWTRHGAGDRSVGFARDVRRFDFICMAGRKIEQRLMHDGLIQTGRYVSGVYAKFDWACPSQHRWTPFDNGRPTVLYAPHFRSTLSSWPLMGEAVLEFFARSDRYNLIFAPHVRLFDAPTPDKYQAFARYRHLPHLHIDLGSERSVDMSYTGAADLYLGDVSSQVAEFLWRPKPCMFLNAHQVKWRDDPSYRFWSLGPVLDSVADLDRDLRAAFDCHPRYAAPQRQYVAETFGIAAGVPTAPLAADAIFSYLKNASAQRPDRVSDLAPAALWL